MKDFDLRKYLSNNPLHQSNIGGFSITELQQSPKSDFEIGLAILNEIGYDFPDELLTEIKIKDLLSKAGSAIKGSLESLALNKSSSKDSKKDFSKKLALLKKLSPSEEVYNKFIKLLKSDKKATVSDLTKLVSSSSKKQIDEKWLSNMPDGVRKTMEWIALGIYLLGFAQNLNYTPKEIDLSNQTATTISVGDDYQPILGDVGDIVDDNAEEDIKDIADEDIDDEVIDSSNTEAKITFGTGGFEADTDAFGDDISNMLTNDLENTDGVGEDGEGYEIDLEHSGNISNTPGDQDDNPDGPAKTGLGDERNKTAKDGAEKGIEKFLKKYPKAKVNLVDGGTNVSDPGEEVESGSDEAKANQTSKVKVTNKKEIKKADPTPEPDDDDGGDDVKTASPKDVIAFYSKKPRMDKSKYEVIFMHILPFIIGNGEDGITKSNPAFEKVIKYLGVFDENETLNDAFINRRIGTDGVLRKELEKAKGEDKEGIENAIKVLTWLRNTKKSPSSIGNFLNKLNPDLQVGKRSANKFRFQKGKETPQASKAARQAPGATKKDPNPTNMMERLVSRIKTTLLEFNSNLLPDYNETVAKTNLGHLLPIYTSIWTGKDDESIPYNVDAIYVYDEKGEPSTKPEYAKSEAYFQKYFDILPKHREDAKQTKQTKEKESEKVDTKTTTTTTTTPKTTDVKVGDTIELDPKVSDKATDSTSSKDDLEKTSKLGKDLDVIKKAINRKAADDDSNKSKKDIESEKEKSATQSDYQKGNEPITPDSQEAGEELGKQKDLVTALNLINTQEELQNLLAGMLSFVAPTLLQSPTRLKTALMQAATVAYDKKGVPDSKRVKKEKSQGLKENLKSSILLSLLLEKVEDKVFKDVTKVVDIINKKPALKNRLLKINQPDELIDFILSELLEKLNDIFAEKDVNIIQALKGVATIAGAGNIKPYNSKEQVKEALTPDEATKVDSKYKEIYSGMLKSNPLKLKKYDNPDAVAYGRAIKLVQKESKLAKESSLDARLTSIVKEVYSEKQRRWACAQDDPKFDEMCKDTAISKKKTMENTRLQELIKAALMGPISEKQRPDYPDVDGDGDTKEPMVKALKDKEKSEANEDVVKGSNIKKVGDDWRVLSGKTGKMWKQKYDSKEDAEAALRGYFANLSEAILKELRG